MSKVKSSQRATAQPTLSVHVSTRQIVLIQPSVSVLPDGASHSLSLVHAQTGSRLHLLQLRAELRALLIRIRASCVVSISVMASFRQSDNMNKTQTTSVDATIGRRWKLIPLVSAVRH